MKPLNLRLFMGALGALASFFMSTAARADCEIVADGKKVAFDGQSLANLMIEKKSLVKLDKQYPKLNVVEKVFKGEAITCSNCTDKYLVCNN